jgi:hypothetical protein
MPSAKACSLDIVLASFEAKFLIVPCIGGIEFRKS